MTIPDSSTTLLLVSSTSEAPSATVVLSNSNDGGSRREDGGGGGGGGKKNTIMALPTLQGTTWRVLPTITNTPNNDNKRLSCPSTVSFVGFGEEANRGTMEMIYKNKGCNLEEEESTSTVVVSGRWLTKPSEIRKGKVQWSARWKVGKYIYKTDILAQPMVDSVEAEMTRGVILQNDDRDRGSQTLKVVGRFTGDLILMEAK